MPATVRDEFSPRAALELQQGEPSLDFRTPVPLPTQGIKLLSPGEETQVQEKLLVPRGTLPQVPLCLNRSARKHDEKID
jgi:hypothetical protein